MMFFLAAALMLLLAAAAVALPLWRGRVHERTGSVAANREVHAARLKELEQDLANGRLSPDDHAAARRDLEADLASASRQKPATSTTKPQRVTAMVALVAVMLVAGSLYWFYGSWRIGAQGVEAASQQAVLDMVDKLAKRLQTPQGQNDLQGWDALGHSYLFMGRYEDALKAFDRARRLSSDSNPRELAGYAEALALSDPDDFMGKALPIFEKTLQLDPSNVQALWYGGLGALQRGDKALAVQRWQAILAQNPPEEYRQTIAKAITDAGGTPVAVAAGVVISLHVTLAADLMGRAAADQTVFVYAQPKDGAGGPPLAVQRLRVADLPADLELSDRDAVIPGRDLSSSDDVFVTARISRTGDAVTQPGDLIGRAEWLKAASKPISITIDTVVK
jgi:cytochrome c-type biogenesis protein CcmH